MSDQPPDVPRTPVFAALLAELATMVLFYSRLPWPRSATGATTAAFADAIRMLPFAAVIIALPGAVVLALSSQTNLSSATIGALTVIVATIVTGAFHEDGLADICDAFAGGATPERRLEIMKDSRIGAFGGVALAAQFGLRAALIADLADSLDSWAAGLVLLGVAAVSRVAPLIFLATLAPARPDGLGRAVGRPDAATLAVACAVACALFVATTAPACGGVAAGLGLGVAGLALIGLGLLARDKIGGYTGDVLGAGTLVTEMAVLIGLAL